MIFSPPLKTIWLDGFFSLFSGFGLAEFCFFDVVFSTRQRYFSLPGLSFSFLCGLKVYNDSRGSYSPLLQSFSNPRADFFPFPFFCNLTSNVSFPTLQQPHLSTFSITSSLYAFSCPGLGEDPPLQVQPPPLKSRYPPFFKCLMSLYAPPETREPFAEGIGSLPPRLPLPFPLAIPAFPWSARKDGWICPFFFFCFQTARGGISFIKTFFSKKLQPFFFYLRDNPHCLVSGTPFLGCVNQASSLSFYRC